MRKRSINNKIREKNFGHGYKINVSHIGRRNKNYYVTGDNKNNINVWSFESDEPVQTFQPSSTQSQQTQVSALTFTIDENQIISGSNRGIINVWDMETAKASCTLKGHSTQVNSFATFPKYDTRLASGSYDTHIKLWDLRTRNNTITLKGHSRQVNTMSISPDCSMLISGSEDHTIKLWDLRYPQKLITTYTDHTAPVNYVAFNPQDMMFASGSADRTAKYFQCEQNEYKFISTTDPHTSSVTALDFSEDGNLLYTACNDSLKIWKMGKGGSLVQTVDSGWRGVQDLCMTEHGLVGVAFNNGCLSFWAYCGMMSESRVKEDQKPEKLPQINPVRSNRNEQLRDVRDNINFALNLVNNLQKKDSKNKSDLSSHEQMPSARQPHKKNFLEELSTRKAEEEKRKEEERHQMQQDRRKGEEQRKSREQERVKKQQLERQRKDHEQRAKKQRLLLQEKEAQRIGQERREAEIAEFNEMIARKQQNKEEVNKLLGSVLGDKQENTLGASAFMIDNEQKEKFQQYDMISEILKDSSKFSTILSVRMSCVKPIINWWANNNIKSALYALNEADTSVVADALSSIFSNHKLKSYVTPEVATALCRKAAEVMQDKQARYVKTSLWVINQIVSMYKDDLIKIKNFAPRGVDLSREDRMAKYDRLVEAFLGVFKMDRLKKYSKQKHDTSPQISQLSSTLYNNLEEILRKWTPKQQPQTV